MSKYEAVIGLETHVELKTVHKLLCECGTAYGSSPNTQICPVCLGYPGSMPILNKEAVALAIRAGLALGCEIPRLSRMARKHYFYPDLPKAYQVSQGDQPLCKHGAVSFLMDGRVRTVQLHRIHIEEDAGKLIHEGGMTKIDCNRCGVPLIEIVSEPQLHSGEEASLYLKALRNLLRAIGVSDCRMQEGALRCDVNVSLREIGTDTLGVKTEIKNVNSFRFAKEAIDAEIARQTALLEKGEKITPVTLRYDGIKKSLTVMRRKEKAADYRFLDEPDLPPIVTDSETVARIKDTLPELPLARETRYLALGVQQSHAEALAGETMLGDFFDRACEAGAPPTVAAALMLSVQREEGEEASVNVLHFVELCKMQASGTVTQGTVKTLLSELLTRDFSPWEEARARDLFKITDKAHLSSLLLAEIEENPLPLRDARGGKKNAAAVYLGKVMKKTDGRADPAILNQLLTEIIHGQDKQL